MKFSTVMHSTSLHPTKVEYVIFKRCRTAAVLKQKLNRYISAILSYWNEICTMMHGAILHATNSRKFEFFKTYCVGRPLFKKKSPWYICNRLTCRDEMLCSDTWGGATPYQKLKIKIINNPRWQTSAICGINSSYAKLYVERRIGRFFSGVKLSCLSWLVTRQVCCLSRALCVCTLIRRHSHCGL